MLLFTGMIPLEPDVAFRILHSEYWFLEYSNSVSRHCLQRTHYTLCMYNIIVIIYIMQHNTAWDAGEDIEMLSGVLTVIHGDYE